MSATPNEAAKTCQIFLAASQAAEDMAKNMLLPLLAENLASGNPDNLWGLEVKVKVWPNGATSSCVESVEPLKTHVLESAPAK